jgi:hypothetical protein
MRSRLGSRLLWRRASLCLFSGDSPGNQRFNRCNFTLQDVSVVFRHLRCRLDLGDSAPDFVEQHIYPC